MADGKPGGAIDNWGNWRPPDLNQLRIQREKATTIMPSIAANFTGSDLRLRRIFRADGRSLIIPLDHATTVGPVGALAHPQQIIAHAATSGADAVMLRPGLARALGAPGSETMGIVMALTGRLTQGADHILINSVEHAIRCGADAICGEFKFGSTGDLENAALISSLTETARKFGIPVLITVYAQPNIVQRLGNSAYAHGCRIAEEIGADIIKTSLPDDADILAECANVTSVPVLLAGGPRRSDSDLEQFLRKAMRLGLAGAAIGRNAWMSDTPQETIRRLSEAVHGIGS